MPIPLQNITVRTISNTVGQVVTIIGIVDHAGPPSRTFFHAINVPENASENTIANIDRRAIAQGVDQFLIWAQNGKPT